MNLVRAVATAVCLAVLTLVVGCSSDDPSDSADSSTAFERSTFLVAGGNVSFDLPSDWEKFDRDKLQDALADSTAMDDLTDRMGVSSEQFGQMLANDVVLFLTAPHARAGYLANVNVIVADGRLPRLGTLELQYRGLGATDVQTSETSTDVGAGYSTTYTLELEGIEVHGEAIVVGVDSETVAITVASNDADETARLANTIRQSLARTL